MKKTIYILWLIMIACMASAFATLTTIDEVKFESNRCYTPRIVPAFDSGVYVTVYEGRDDVGLLKTWDIKNNGTLPASNNSVLDIWQFDTACATPDILTIYEGNYKLIAYQNNTDGIFQTAYVHPTTGVITPSNNPFKFDAVGATPDLVVVSDGLDPGIYAVAYEGNDSDGFVATFNISGPGGASIAPVDILEFDDTNGETPQIIHVSGEIYAIAYSQKIGIGPEKGLITTIAIDSAGNINDTVLDKQIYETSTAVDPSIINVSSNIFAIAYRGAQYHSRRIKTIRIENNGTISNSTISDFDNYDYQTWLISNPDIIHITDEIYAVAYEDRVGNGDLITVRIDSNGIINDSVQEEIQYDGEGGHPDILHLSGDVYVIAYEYFSVGDRGYMITLDITTNITTCAGLNITGDNYLNSNFTLSQDCQLFGTINLLDGGEMTFDCDNHWLTGNWTPGSINSSCIEVFRNYTKIINCNFRNYGVAINFTDEHYTDFELNNDNFKDCGFGLNSGGTGGSGAPMTESFANYKTYNCTFENVFAAIYLDVYPGGLSGEIVNITTINSETDLYLVNSRGFVLNDLNLWGGVDLWGNFLLISDVIVKEVFQLRHSSDVTINNLECSWFSLENTTGGIFEDVNILYRGQEGATFDYVNDSIFNDFVINGSEYGAAGFDALKVTNSNNLSITGISIYDIVNASGINITQNSHNITITDSEIINVTSFGVFISDPTTSGITINDTDVWYSAGITISNSGLHTITNNWIEYVSPTLLYSYFIASNYNNVVENNIFDNGAINRIQPYITSPSGIVNKNTNPQVTISWNALVFNPTKFQIQHSPNNVDWTDIGNVAGTETSISWTISSLPAGVRYFRVYGVDAYGTSELDFPNSMGRITISTGVSAGGGGGGGIQQGGFEITFTDDIPLDTRLVVIDSVGREVFNSLISNVMGLFYMNQGSLLYLNRGQYTFFFTLVDGSTVSYVTEITGPTQLSFEGKVQKNIITGAVVGDEGEKRTSLSFLGKIWEWLKGLF